MSSALYKLMRYKFIDLPIGTTTMNFYGHDNQQGTVTKICEKDIVVLPMHACGSNDYKYVKYLSSDGKYKFIPFQKYVTLTQEDTQLGTVNKMMTDLKTAQGNSYSLGYSSVKRMQLTTNCSEEQYNEWVKVFQSPRVYLQFKDPNLYDEDENWLLVTVDSAPEFSTKKRKNTFSMTITLPDYNNITM